MRNVKIFLLGLLGILGCTLQSHAGEADIHLPDLNNVVFPVPGFQLGGMAILYAGLVVCALATIYGWRQYQQIAALPVHPRMKDVSNIIWETCKTYLFQQGRFLSMLWILIAACMV